MVTEWAAFRPHRRTGTAAQIALEHLRAAGVRKKPEQLDRRPEQRDHARADTRCHVHHPRVAGDEHSGAGETGPRFLQRKLSRRVVNAGTHLGGELAVARTTDRHESVAHRSQLLRQCGPVANRPALGRVRGAGGERRERLPVEASLGEPARDALACRGRQKKLWCAAVGVRVERPRRLEVAFGYRHVPSVHVDLRRDQRGSGQFAFRVAAPLARDEKPQRGTAEAAVQVEPVRRPEGPQPAGEVGDSLLRLELDDPVQIRVFDDQRRHRPLGDEIQLGVGMAPVQRAHEGSGEENVADGAEPDAQDAQHAANVLARCPASPAGLACLSMPRPKSILWIDDEDDYLVKPVHPRQVLSVVTRLLEGDRIRQQRLARDFVTRFRELEGRRGGALAWREWSELVAELARWEVRLAAGDEPGLSEALRALQESLRKDFQGFIIKHYPRWLADPERDRPPLSVDVGAEFLVPVLKRTGRVVFILIDCLRLDQWEVLRDLITPLFDVEESHYYSILPTATPFSRNAIFSGLFPMEIAARHPEWWGAPTDEESLNAHEAELLAEQLRELVGQEVPVRYEKLFTAADGTDLLRRLPAHLAQPGVTALVFNFIDQLTHGRSENAILYEVARDADALRGLTKTWFERSPVLAALEEAERRNVPVLLTTDHGSIHCQTPATVFAKRDATANLRYKFGEDLRAEDPEAAIMVEDLKSYGLPAKGLGVRLLLATGDRFFVYPTKLRE